MKISSIEPFSLFLVLGLGGKSPDRNTIWMVREAFKRAGVMDEVTVAFEGNLR